MRNLFILIIGLCILLAGCTSKGDFLDKLKENTPPNLIIKTLKYHGTPIAKLEFQQYLARDYFNDVDTGYIDLKITNLESQLIDSLGITIFLHLDENRSSDSLAQAKRKEFLITGLVDTLIIPIFNYNTVSTLKTTEHIEVFCTKYNNQNTWSDYYIGQVEAFDTISTATFLGSNNVYGVITADNKLDFRLPESSISTQQIRGSFTTNFSAFVGIGYNDAGDTTAILSLDRLVATSVSSTNVILNYQAISPTDVVDSLSFSLFN
jgi:hypothetical protein